ncbi:MAG: hypothetical protein Kow0097_03100 [Candidatus Bipolaricaulota bacterium]
MPTPLDGRDAGRWTLAESPWVGPLGSYGKEVGARARGSRAQENGFQPKQEVIERANPGRPGDAKPQVSCREMAGLPKHLQEKHNSNFLEVQ